MWYQVRRLRLISIRNDCCSWTRKSIKNVSLLVRSPSSEIFTITWSHMLQNGQRHFIVALLGNWEYPAHFLAIAPLDYHELGQFDILYLPCSSGHLTDDIGMTISSSRIMTHFSASHMNQLLDWKWIFRKMKFILTIKCRTSPTHTHLISYIILKWL